MALLQVRDGAELAEAFASAARGDTIRTLPGRYEGAPFELAADGVDVEFTPGTDFGELEHGQLVVHVTGCGNCIMGLPGHHVSCAPRKVVEEPAPPVVEESVVEVPPAAHPNPSTKHTRRAREDL